MSPDEYADHDATGLAELVSSGAVTAAELLDTALARLQQINPTINAVNLVLEQSARDQLATDLGSGILAGVPFLLKDITTQLRGAPTSAGSELFRDAVAPEDSALVAAYRRNGLVMFGKSNTPEFGLLGVTEPRAFGRTLNPWDAGRISGGSSGGSAAAVSAGIVPAAQASDAGGSIRIPSACCGVFGLKPSRARVSMAPLVEGWGGMTVLHAITRSVRDSAALLDIACETAAADPFALVPPATPYREQLDRPPAGLRIGFLRTNLMQGAPEAELIAAVESAASLCEALGHQVEEMTLANRFDTIAVDAFPIAAAGVALTLELAGRRLGRAVTEQDVEPLTWAIAQKGAEISAGEYIQALGAMNITGRTVFNAFQAYDVVITSTLAQLPPPVDQLTTDMTDLAAIMDAFYGFAPNTQPFNMSGQPAMSVPLAWSASGLPIGVQFVGQFGREDVLLRLAAQLEQARPWAQRRPPAWTS
jgi:amidase